MAPVRQFTDSVWVVPSAKSVIFDHDGNLDEVRDEIEAQNRFQASEINGHLYYREPIGVVLLAVPFVAAGAVVDRLFDTSLLESPEPLAPPPIESIAAAAITAAAVTVFFLLSLRQLRDKPALLLTGAFAFASPALSTASRGLWMHGPSMLALLSALWALQVAAEKKSARVLFLAGCLTGLAVVIRPTNAIAALAFSVYALVTHRRETWRYLVGGGTALLIWLGLNRWYYGVFWPPYNNFGQQLTVGGSLLQGLAGDLVSPARGLFVYCPLVLFAVLGILLRRSSGAFGALDVALIAIVVCHWLVVASAHAWWGGVAYGPRLMTDIVPLLFWFLIPVASALTRSGVAIRRRSLVTTLFGLSVLWSLYVNMAGALHPGTFVWNIEPNAVDSHPERLWDWTDPPFLRPFR